MSHFYFLISFAHSDCLLLWGLRGVTPITSAVVMTNAMLAKTMPESEFAQANSVLAETIP